MLNELAYGMNKFGTLKRLAFFEQTFFFVRGGVKEIYGALISFLRNLYFL